MEVEGTSVGEGTSESVFRSVSEAEVSLDEMLSLACRQGKRDIVELLLESGANVNHRNKAGNTPLLEACSQGHVSIARLLLNRHADIDAPTETTYDSALTWACTLGNEDVVALLLERNAAVEHRTKDGCTALMFAALAGHERVARLLLDHRAEINVESDSNKDSPLTFACWKGHQRVVELFLRRKADLEHRTKEGFSPLMFAALGGHTQVAELLLKHGAQVNTPSGSNNDIPLTSACWKGHHKVVALLLQHGSNIEHRTKDGCTPLMLAAREGHLTVAQLLLQQGAKVNVPSGSENNIPLTLACWKGHRDVVHLLLRHSSNIEHQNKAGCTPLMLAAREGHYEATKLLLDSGAQINTPSGSNDDTPLTLACWKGHERVVQLLLGRGSAVNHQTKTGCTPLMEATREGHVGVAQLLLDAGADVETPDNYGQSPFFMACWKGHGEVAALLLEYEANKDCRTKTGITPLFQACRENHVGVVKLLLDYGCNPSTPFPSSRECPLTLAAEKGFADLAQLLVSRNAHIECRTKKGCTPFFLACKEGYREIAVMLAKHGADTEACDQRSQTSLLVAFKNGHVELVDWLLGHVTHLPSDAECQKVLHAPSPPATDLTPQRTKCLEMISKAKKAREQAALRNAQSLFEELDAEKERQESRKKAAAKKRSRRKERKKKELAEKQEAEVVVCTEELPAKQVAVPSPPPQPSPSTPMPAPSSPAPTQKKAKRKRRKKHPKPLAGDGGEEEEKESCGGRVEREGEGGEENDSADDLEYHDARSELPEASPAREESSSSNPSPSPSPTSSPSPTITTRGREEPGWVEGRKRRVAMATTECSHAATKEPTVVRKRQSRDWAMVAARGTTHQVPGGGARRGKEEGRVGEEVREKEDMWSSSQDSMSGWCSEEMELEHLQALSRCSTDDDKIRSQKLMAAGETGPRPVVTTAVPTPPSTSTTSPSPSPAWHAVTRTTRTVQMTVSNALVGRVIGRSGAKINSIQEMSGAHITVSRNIPKSAERLVTVKGTQHSVGRAQELIMEALSTPDRDSDIFIPQPPSHTHSARLRKRQSEMALSTTAPPVTMATRRISLPSAPATATATPPLVSPVSSTAATPPTPSPSSRSESSKYISTESQDPASSLRVKRSATPLTPAEDGSERGQQEEEGGQVEEKVEEEKDVSSEPPPPQPEPGLPPATLPVPSAPPHSRPHRSVAVIQPTQHYAQAPVGSPPFEPPLPPHCYGAIGPPPQGRRGSLPMATSALGRAPSRKSSYAGVQWLPEQQYMVPPVLPLLESEVEPHPWPHPPLPINPIVLSHDSDRDKSLSVSWSGRQQPPLGPLSPSPAPFLSLGPHQSQLLRMQRVQPSTPDKLQGEPWDFHSPTPGALYGAIGSGLPSTAATQSSFHMAGGVSNASALGNVHLSSDLWQQQSALQTSFPPPPPPLSLTTLTPPPPPPLPPVHTSMQNITRMVVTTPTEPDQWPALPATLPPSSTQPVGEQGVGQAWGASESGEGGRVVGDLQHLMQSLDIAEHLHVLQDKKLSLKQLMSLSDEEWRSLKLPVGPRVKLMNAVSNMSKTPAAPPVCDSSDAVQ